MSSESINAEIHTFQLLMKTNICTAVVSAKSTESRMTCLACRIRRLDVIGYKLMERGIHECPGITSNETEQIDNPPVLLQPSNIRN